MKDPTDRELIALVIAHDETAFRTLYHRHTPAMYAAARRLTARSQSGAEDVVQEAWLRGIRQLRMFRGESALRTWLVGITIRCALEAGRRAIAVPPLDPDAIAVPPDVPPLDLEAAIAALADGYRQVLLLHDLYGYTHAEIAALAGIEEGTSKSQLSRARAALRRWLARDPQECSHGR
jgi:RNA polymerase sigma-70 factor (ECF subfamily)